MSSPLRYGLAAGFLFTLGAYAHAEPPLWKQPAYSNAIQAARGGKPQAALDMLEAEQRKAPLTGPLLDDYLTLLGWVGRKDEALQKAHAVDPATLSADTLAQLGRIARDKRDYPYAVTLYRQALAKSPSADHSAGLAMALSDSGDSTAALSVLDAAQSEAPKDQLGLTRARAYILAHSPNLTGALAYLQSSRERFPNDPDLERSYTELLLRLGAPQSASDSLKQSRLLDQDLNNQVELDRIAYASRWGDAEERTEQGEARYRTIDKALIDSKVIKSQLPESAARQRMTALADRLVLLQQRNRSREAIKLYESQPEDKLPAYAEAAVADAYLKEQQPKRAIQLYEHALANTPPKDAPLDWRLGLVNAYEDAGQTGNAERAMAQLKADTPRIRYDAPSRQNRYNPDYGQVMQADAMLQAHHNRTALAQQKLDGMLDEAPYNPELRSNRGALALLRGQPREAAGIYTRVLVDEPDYTDAKIGLASAQIESDQFAAAEKSVAAANAAAPERQSTQQLNQEWYWQNRPELVVDSGKDLSGARGTGQSNEWNVEARLYSAPFDYNWRIFVRTYDGRASFDDAPDARRDTAGAGVNYRSANWTGEAAITQSTDGTDRVGGFIAANWTPNDKLSVGLRHEEDTDAIPIKGRLSDVHGRNTSAELGYRVDDIRQFMAAVNTISMSDGNRRDALTANWTERWYSGPTYRIDTILSAYASQNRDIPSALYFNPQRDNEIGLTALQDWLLWRNSTTTLHHRLGLYLGNYYQQGFGSDTSWLAYYEQEWAWTSRASLRYGFARNSHPYDGVSDAGNRIYMNLDWRL
ncbi:poly-beta-1,6 N-acetyl-D-glucosamine export porin PgaA [Crenobacter sp. SG2305]|uniref:poly-beta-1,6 N-acetyl-D-glucosamine export porin PgaA n=1 Tax=Crenobacter oryzisoli TaxID=3056844 RepID=UPI0025AAFA52|nr:poly-beta-1,6 N-acetyl-D-glucosamine export porin PgaA [Crenobacter sp. SG2305]MDN0084715.1 poly-beta-1,6 N-acetyl-D-glucosamine export porin PgaA [Crenobacter sp. SG2305]